MPIPNYYWSSPKAKCDPGKDVQYLLHVQDESNLQSGVFIVAAVAIHSCLIAVVREAPFTRLVQFLALIFDLLF